MIAEARPRRIGNRCRRRHAAARGRAASGGWPRHHRARHLRGRTRPCQKCAHGRQGGACAHWIWAGMTQMEAVIRRRSRKTSKARPRRVSLPDGRSPRSDQPDFAKALTVTCRSAAGCGGDHRSSCATRRAGAAQRFGPCGAAVPPIWQLAAGPGTVRRRASDEAVECHVTPCEARMPDHCLCGVPAPVTWRLAGQSDRLPAARWRSSDMLPRANGERLSVRTGDAGMTNGI